MKNINKIKNLFLSSIFKRLKIVILFKKNKGFGDQLMISSIIEAYKEKVKFIVICPNTEFFKFNPNVLFSIKITNSKKYSLVNLVLINLIKMCESDYVHYLRFKSHSPQHKNTDLCFSNEYIKKIESKDLSLAEINSLHFKTKIFKSKLIPKIYFNKDEIEKMKLIFNDLPNKIKIIVPSGKRSFSDVKNNPISIFKNVTNLKGTWIEIGDKKILEKTKFIDYTKYNIRELAYIVSRAELVVCNEGFYSHLAAALNIKCVTIMSGFSNLNIIKYANQLKIHTPQAVSCSPCWRKTCNQKVKKCVIYPSDFNINNKILSFYSNEEI